MYSSIPNLTPVAAELSLLIFINVILLVDVYFGTRWRNLTYQLTQIAIVATALLSISLTPASAIISFHGHYISDPLSGALKVAILLICYYAFFYLRTYLRERDELQGEYFIIGLFAVLGMLVLVSAHSLLTIYLGLELLSLSMYALVALRRESVLACEAAMKYFVLGALASGMLLYGMSLIYGTTTSLDLTEIRRVALESGHSNITLMLGLVFVVVGVAFKLGAAPFHMWVPDVYEGAPTGVTLFIGTAPKVAAFGMLVRLLIDGLEPLQADWGQMLIILSVLSMGIGNIVAIAQRNIKRMLAYSTIAHAGFLFLGLTTATAEGYASAMFYIITYALMAAGSFALVIGLGRKGHEADKIDDFKGLFRKHPWFAFMTMILMLSMAGVPPFLGFWAKWGVLQTVIDSGNTWLAVLAVVFSVMGLFYYLRIVRFVYFDDPESEVEFLPSQDFRIMFSTNALAILLLGLFPGALMSISRLAFAG